MKNFIYKSSNNNQITLLNTKLLFNKQLLKMSDLMLIE